MADPKTELKAEVKSQVKVEVKTVTKIPVKADLKGEAKTELKAEAKTEAKAYKHIVRIAQTDLDGSKPVYKALTKIKGISFMFSNLVCELAEIDKFQKTGEVDEKTIQKLNTVIENPLKFNAPSWMLNRRKDYEDGTDKHLLSGTLDFARQTDIRTLQKIKAYRGVRHYYKLPTRGQRTKSNFRRNKGKATGVMKKSLPGKK